MSLARARAFTLILIFIGGLTVAFFGLRSLRAFREVREHRPPAHPAPNAEQIETDVDMIREWMTIPFIAKTYHVPAIGLFDALGIPPERNREKSLKRLNREYFPQAGGFVLDKIKATILANQPQQIQNEIPVIPLTPTPVAVP